MKKKKNLCNILPQKKAIKEHTKWKKKLLRCWRDPMPHADMASSWYGMGNPWQCLFFILKSVTSLSHM